MSGACERMSKQNQAGTSRGGKRRACQTTFNRPVLVPALSIPSDWWIWYYWQETLTPTAWLSFLSISIMVNLEKSKLILLLLITKECRNLFSLEINRPGLARAWHYFTAISTQAKQLKAQWFSAVALVMKSKKMRIIRDFISHRP